jgi:signal transduction histidine kinase
MYEDFIQQKHVMVNTDWLKEEIVIKVDKDKIKQVLLNLIKNALESVNNNGKIDIKVGFTDENRVFFEITNDGPPIPPEIKEKLFTPFLTTKSNGTGLGLAICKKIIEEEHKGKIYLVKSDDTETSFRFEIPTGNN